MSLKYEEIIDGLIEGKLKSPQVDGESFYILLRITGTGITERYKTNDKGEPIVKDGKPEVYKINRLEDEFLSDNFLNACNGIPVLIEHPKSNNQLIDGENFKEHIVGTIIKAFIKGSEVWGVARILDPTVLNKIVDNLKSTSPAVTSRNEVGNNDIVNEHFDRIDHLALVVDGYWDDYSDKAIQIDKKNKIKIEGDNMDKKELVLELVSILENLGIDEKTMLEINAKLDKLASDEPTNSTKTEEVKEEEREIKEDEAKKEEPKVDEPKDEGKELEGLATKLIELIISKSTPAPAKEPAPELEVKKDEPKAEPVLDNEDDLINAEDEEEKNEIIDEAIKLNQSYADMKCPKSYSHDTKESYLRKVLLLNKSFIDSKYKSLVDRLTKNNLNKDEYGLAVDCFKSIGNTLKTQADAKIKADAKKEINAKRVEKTANGTVYHNVI